MRSTRLAVLGSGLLLVAACSTGGGATPAPTAAPPTAAPTAAATTAASIPAVVCVGAATTYLDWLNGDFQPDVADPIPSPSTTATDDLLAQVQSSGKLRISTDKDYAPQSFLQPDGTFVGFDIDVGTKIAEALGVEAEFQHVDWDLITAGNWANRWDISVGSMTITIPSATHDDYYARMEIASGSHMDINITR